MARVLGPTCSWGDSELKSFEFLILTGLVPGYLENEPQDSSPVGTISPPPPQSHKEIKIQN